LAEREEAVVHELSLCEAIVDLVESRAAGRSVRRVEVRIGYFRQVVPDSLQFSWTVLTEGTWLAGCELVIDHVPAVVRCACGAESILDTPILVCSTCASFEVVLICGSEFDVAWIELAEVR
jgi:hydrogenase nickel incorporation protein HypA/HybF